MSAVIEVLPETEPKVTEEPATIGPAGRTGPWQRWLDFAARFGLAGRTAFWTIVLGAAMAGTIGFLMYQAGVSALVDTQSRALELQVNTAALRFDTRIEFGEPPSAPYLRFAGNDKGR